MSSQIFGNIPEHDEMPIPTKHEREEYHNFLEALMMSELYPQLPEETQFSIALCRDVLCWTLGHENGTFEKNLIHWSEHFKAYFDKSDSFLN